MFALLALREKKKNVSPLSVVEEINSRCHSSKQDQDRQKQLAQQRLITWQQKDQSELNKVKEELKALETGTKPVPVSSTNIGALQV